MPLPSRLYLVAFAALAHVACGRTASDPMPPATATSPTTPVATAPPSTASAASALTVASAAAEPSADASAAPAASAAAPSASATADAPDAGAADASAPIDWKNEQKYTLASDELTERARGLFEAIVKDDPTLAEPFWFPEEPFTPLKDVKNPNKYWKQLHRAYANDVHKLHRKRKSWDGATFESFTVGSTPKWVKPGDEVNKIGYYRSFRGKLRYRVGDQTSSLEVHTIITWQGRWYVTHLSKLKK
jgi:hypothetical protein